MNVGQEQTPSDKSGPSYQYSEDHEDSNQSTPRNKDAELFIGDLSFFCTEVDLHQLFAPFGQIVKIRIKRSGLTRRTLMYGFVIMSTAEEAKNARDALHGHRYMGRDMRVEGSSGQSSTPSPHQQRVSGRKLTDFQIHLTFTNKSSANHRHSCPRADESFMRSIFETKNLVVKDVAMKEYSAEKIQEGFCFVAFNSLYEAENACSLVDGKIIDGYSFTASLSHHNPARPNRNISRANSRENVYGTTGHQQFQQSSQPYPMLQMAPSIAQQVSVNPTMQIDQSFHHYIPQQVFPDSPNVRKLAGPKQPPLNPYEQKPMNESTPNLQPPMVMHMMPYFVPHSPTVPASIPFVQASTSPMYFHPHTTSPHLVAAIPPPPQAIPNVHQLQHMYSGDMGTANNNIQTTILMQSAQNPNHQYYYKSSSL